MTGAYVSPIPKGLRGNYAKLDEYGMPAMEELHLWPEKDRARPCNPAGCRECYRERNWKRGQTHGR